MRTFMAIETSNEISSLVKNAQGELKKMGFYGSWPSIINTHMTLFFFGDVSHEKVKKISTLMDENASKFESFPLRIDKMGFFPSRGLPRVIWVGTSETEEIGSLYREFNLLLARVGFKFSDEFIPHITVGRIKGVPKSWKERIFDVRFEPVEFVCEKIGLFSSKLTPRGSIYTLIHESVLGGSNHER